jgi:nucleolar MIF4G domain-containing protein 1
VIHTADIHTDVTSTLTTLIINGISSHSILVDSYVVLYAAFVSSLHKIIGVEFGVYLIFGWEASCQSDKYGSAAFFVQNVVSSYETHNTALRGTSQLLNTIQPEAELEVLGKECSNLIVLLSELYNFQVISSVLVFDIIRDLLDQKITEFSIELLLKIIGSKCSPSYRYYAFNVDCIVGRLGTTASSG